MRPALEAGVDMLLLFALALGQTPDPTVDSGDAIQTYMAQRLVVARQPVTTVYAKAYDGSGTFWFVEQNGRQLSARDFAHVTGDHAVAEASKQRSRRRGRGGAALAVAGLAAIGTGFMYPLLGLPEGAEAGWYAGSFGGGTAALLGGTVLMGTSVGNSHPSALYSEHNAEERARAYNAELRQTLLPSDAEPAL